MDFLSVSELEEGELAPAYALVRTLAPGVSLDRWLSFARTHREHGGFLALRGEQGVLFGLLSYREEDSLRLQRVLRIENFISFELSAAAPGRKALFEAAEAIARDRGCAAVRVTIGGAEAVTAKLRGWAALGLDAEQVVLTKRLDNAGRPRAEAAAVAQA